MFEHFGIMDIWCGFKKYKTTILFVMISFAVLFTGKFLLSSKKTSESAVEVNNDNIYISTSAYYVEPRVDMLGKSDSNLYKTMPDDYVTMLNTDFCRKYMLDKLSSIYTHQYIIDNSGLGKGEAPLSPEDMDINSMKELYQVKKYSNTMIIEVSSMTYSKELSQSVRNACEEFLISNVDNQIVNSSIKLSGEADRTIKSSELAAENIDKSDKRNIVKMPTAQKSNTISFVKKVMIPLFLIAALCVAVLIVIGLFRPTLNRISDFSEYEVKVIGEIKNYMDIKE